MPFATLENTPDLFSEAPYNHLVITTTGILNQQLFDYQVEILRCIAYYQRVAVVASRQIGKSVSIAFLALSWALNQPEQTILIISTGERQVKELLTKRQYSIKKIYKNARKAGSIQPHFDAPQDADGRQYTMEKGIYRPIGYDDDPKNNICQKSLIKAIGQNIGLNLEFGVVSENAEEIEFPNGSRIVVVPANPDTASGYTANLLIGDEIAKMPNWDEMQAACFPFVARVGGKIALFSSYRGKNHWYYITKDKLSPNNPKGWLVLKYPVTVNPPPDLEQLKHDLPPERFEEEYMCIPIESTYSLFPYTLIDACSQGHFEEWH